MAEKIIDSLIFKKSQRYFFFSFFGFTYMFFDRESISHGPTSLKIVVLLLLLGTLLKVSFNVTVQFLFPQKSQNVPKSLKKVLKVSKSPKSLKTSPKVSTSPKRLKQSRKSQKSFKCLKKYQNVSNLTVKH